MAEDTAHLLVEPPYGDPLPDFQVLRSSDAQGWQGVRVCQVGGGHDVALFSTPARVP